MRKLIAFLVLVLLSACAAPSTATAVLPTKVPPTVAVTHTPLPHTIIDPSTMTHKLLMGYQGWFTCPSDGSKVNGYFHWFHDNIPDAAHFRVDMYPDMRELNPDELCPTQMKMPDGSPAYLYSAYNPKTVMRHFQWMSQYGVDGVFVQRFGSELSDPVHFDTRNVVTQNVRLGAEAYGRVFAVMYDTSGMDTSTFAEFLEKDWKYMVDVMKVTESPAYLHHNGKPVLAIWGLGFTEHPGTPDQAKTLLDFFQNNPDPKYQVTLMGGVPTLWRTLQGDSLTDPAWMDYYCGLDILSPWTVGRYRSNLDVDFYKLMMIQDMAKATECGVEYMPVVFPGTAFHNNNHANLFNDTPRRGGEFYWRQVYNAISIGVPMIYNAMFDEVDEDTAMYKIAETSADQPVGVDLVAMDTDGYKLPSDWYLQLAGVASQMLRGDIPLTAKIPIQSGATPPPTPEGTIRVRLQLTTSSDWMTLTLDSGGSYADPELVSSSPEAINLGASGNRFSLGQSLAKASSGNKVELVLDISLSGLQTGRPLHFTLESGAIGATTIRFYTNPPDSPVSVFKTVLSGTNNTFEVPAAIFLSQ